MRIIETSMEEDLSLFSRYLRQQRVPHRIFEERGRQVVEVADARVAEPVRNAYHAWRSGRLVLESSARGAPAGGAPAGVPARLLHVARRYPVLVGLLALAVLVFPFSLPLADGELTRVAGWLTIVDLSAPGSSGLPTGEFWRWLGPIFLHFSVVHLLFNVAVTADLGRRIEYARGSVAFALLVAGIGVVSNLGQYLLGGNPVFGGLSGVAYGLLGFVLVSQRRFPGEPAWRVHPGFAFSLLLFLVIFSTGITEPFGLYVANEAHWLGLASGALTALLLPLRAVRTSPGTSDQ